MTDNLPPLPDHPDPHVMTWSESERRSIKNYGEECARAAIAQQSGVPADARSVIELCQKALAEELSAWDTDPPIHHVQEAHDACSAWLAASPQPQPVAQAKPEQAAQLQALSEEEVRKAVIDCGMMYTAPDARVAKAIQSALAAKNGVTLIPRD